MGTYKEYKCINCGYTVEANPKGHDLIMAGEVYSYLCKECREIVDVLRLVEMTNKSEACNHCRPRSSQQFYESQL